MGQKPPVNGHDAEHSSDCFRVVDSQNLCGTDLSQFSYRAKVILFQPLRHIGILTLIARQFDDSDNCVSVPVYDSALPINPHKVWYCCVGSLAHISLVMKFIPEFMPDWHGVVFYFKPR